MMTKPNTLVTIFIKIPALFSKATLADLPATHSKNAHTRPNKAVVFKINSIDYIFLLHSLFYPPLELIIYLSI